MEWRARPAGLGVLFAFLARWVEGEQDCLSRMGRQAGFAWHDPAWLLAVAGLDFAGCGGGLVLGRMVAQFRISLGSKMDSHCRVSVCAVLGDSLDVGGRFGPRHSRAAVFVCRHPCLAFFREAPKNSNR